MRPLIALLACALAAGASAPAAALDPDKAFHHYVRNTWSIEEGLPQISALALVQDRQGYLWVGTQAGLARFDGVRFTTHTPADTPGLRGIWINDLHVDAGNRLWVATYRGLSMRDDDGFHALPVEGDADGTRLLDTRDIEAMPSGELRVAAPDGVWRVDGERLVLDWPLPRPANVLLAHADAMWVGSQGRVYRITGDTTQVLPLPDGDGDTVVTRLAATQGRLWAGTSAGLFFLEGGQWLRYEGGAPLSEAPIEALRADGDGNLWVGMVQDLARLRAGRLQEVVSGDRAGTAVRAIFEDREGNLWLGSQWEGISRLWNGWTRRYGAHEGLHDPILWSVARGPDGRLWVGGNDGLSVMEDGRFRRVLTGGELPHPNAYTLLPEANRVWIGTRRGVAVWDGSAVQTPAELAPMRGAQINGMLRDRRGALWFATTQGLFRQTRDGLRAFGAADGLRDPRTRVLHQARDGRLLLGTQSGLYEIVGERLETVGEKEGLPPDLDITAIHELADGRLVVGTLSEQILLFDGRRWTAFGHADGLPVNSAYHLSDEGGFLWVAGMRGIFRVPLADLQAVTEGRATRVRGEMVLNERGDRGGGQKGYCCNGAGNAKGLLDRGQLWLPTRDGLVAMDTGGVVRNPVAPQTLIERVRVGDDWRDADAGADWRLPADRRDLAFEFTVLGFQDPGSNGLRYRLLGYDADWREPDSPSQRSAAYTNLPAGSYVFEVMGSNNAGVWSAAPAQLGFHVSPHFQETPLFYTLMAALLASLVYAGYRGQLGSHRRQRKALEQLVRQRTEALEVANHRLEDASQSDAPTGLRNRRYLGAQLPADLAFYAREALRQGAADGRVLFAMLEPDHLDALVARHGPAVLDRLLPQLAHLLVQRARAGDYVARWSERRFLLVFRPLPAHNLPALGERLRQAVASQPFDVGTGEPLRLTCSIGFGECPLFRESRGGPGWEQRIELAARALDYVRERSRNGWAAFQPAADADPDSVLLALDHDPATLLAQGRLRLLASPGLGGDTRR